MDSLRISGVFCITIHSPAVRAFDGALRKILLVGLPCVFVQGEGACFECVTRTYQREFQASIETKLETELETTT